MHKIEKIARDLIEQNEEFVVAKVVDTKGSTPRKKGAYLLIKKDSSCYGSVGGGKLEHEVEKIALETFGTKESNIYKFKLKDKEQQGIDMRCGGDAEISIEYIDHSNSNDLLLEFGVNSKAIIFGAGHIGLAIEPILRNVDFSTVVIDDRSEFANRERFLNADKVIVIDSYKNPFNKIDIETDENTYIIIVTRGHMGDYEVLKASLNVPNAYIGMIGSKKKVADIYNLLKKDGFTDEILDGIYAPIGLPISAETPEEIAISIEAQMIQVRAKK